MRFDLTSWTVTQRSALRDIFEGAKLPAPSKDVLAVLTLLLSAGQVSGGTAGRKAATEQNLIQQLRAGRKSPWILAPRGLGMVLRNGLQSVVEGGDSITFDDADEPTVLHALLAAERWPEAAAGAVRSPFEELILKRLWRGNCHIDGLAHVCGCDRKTVRTVLQKLDVTRPAQTGEIERDPVSRMPLSSTEPEVARYKGGRIKRYTDGSPCTVTDGLKRCASGDQVLEPAAAGARESGLIGRLDRPISERQGAFLKKICLQGENRFQKL